MPQRLSVQDVLSFRLMCPFLYDAVSDHLESLSASVTEILTAGRLDNQCPFDMVQPWVGQSI